MPGVAQFDNVRIASTPETLSLGYGGRLGVCYGSTIPTVTGVDVIGSTSDDYALNVHFESADVDDAWFAADLVELVDHGVGTRITIGSKAFVRRDDGSWEQLTPSPAD
ncbi:MAG: hypothetical protein ACREN2_11975 [Candidatus Dormibacteria bacterium]